MKKFMIAAAILIMVPCTAFAQAAGYSTTATTIGTLLDDPATRAVLDKHIPGMSTNAQVEMARGMTLKEVQPFSPEAVTDKVLADIDADFAKLKSTK